MRIDNKEMEILKNIYLCKILKEWISIRLFIALNFKDEVKAQITDVINKMKSNSIQGKFVNEENMHLTVEFLGEIENTRIDLIKEVMDKLDYKKFTLSLTKIGYFKKSEGNIYWLGIDENDILINLYNKLHQGLLDKGFKLEDRPYRPHITLGRKVSLKDDLHFDDIKHVLEKIKIDIDRVDLMKSEFVKGGVVHSVVYSKLLCN